MSDVLSIIKQIRRYTARHDELLAATILSYDVPLPINSCKTVDAVVFGLNEREYAADQILRQHIDRPLEDHSLGSFREGMSVEAAFSRKKAENWYGEIRSYIGESRPAILGELFFWSSINTRDDFKRRYKSDFRRSEHLQFCTRYNNELLSLYRPRVVAVLGLSYLQLVRSEYRLDKMQPEIVRGTSGKTLLVKLHDGTRPWIVARHPTGAWDHATATDRATIQRAICECTC